MEPRPQADTEGHRGGRAAVELQTPMLIGRHAHLRPVLPGHYQLMQALESNQELTLRWKFRGATPDPETWARELWDDVLAQFLVFAPGDETPRGLVVAHKPSFLDGIAYLSALRYDTDSKSAAMMRGLALFVEYVFATWPFRKLFMEVPEYNLAQFQAGMGRYFATEGRLRERLCTQNQLWDLVVLAVTRERWCAHGTRIARLESST